jgi:hypothetical protein
LWARSPVAPKRTTIWGSLGPTPAGIFAIAFSASALAFGGSAVGQSRDRNATGQNDDRYPISPP